MIYSCGYVKDPAGTVEDFQRDKLQRICEKLRLQPGERLVDIGCGYGGLLIYAAQNFGVSGKGCTLGKRHYERAKANVAAAGLSDKIQIEHAPFDSLTGKFDKLVSVEMIEHLRRSQYKHYVDVVSRLLTDKGMGLLHYIGCTERSNDHDPFIQKYILADTSQPKLSEVVGELEDHDMAVLDVENLVAHYGPTLLAWKKDFMNNSGGSTATATTTALNACGSTTWSVAPPRPSPRQARSITFFLPGTTTAAASPKNLRRRGTGGCLVTTEA